MHASAKSGEKKRRVGEILNRKEGNFSRKGKKENQTKLPVIPGA